MIKKILVAIGALGLTACATPTSYEPTGQPYVVLYSPDFVTYEYGRVQCVNWAWEAVVYRGRYVCIMNSDYRKLQHEPENALFRNINQR